MTIEQVDRMVRGANPVPDLKALEPVDLSDLRVTQQRSGDMQTQDRIEMDQEPQRPNRGLLIGAAAVVLLLIGALVFFQSREEAPVVTQVPEDPTAAVETSTAYLEAYTSFDIDEAFTYLAVDAEGLGTIEEERLNARFFEAMSSKTMLEPCEEVSTSAEGAVVSCDYTDHFFRSDEIGRGPFGPSTYVITVLNGEIVSVEQTSTEDFTDPDGFSKQMWEPFAAWVGANYPDDKTVMYDPYPTGWRITEESIPVWEQRNQEWVEVVGAEGAAAVETATAFLDAYRAFDVDQAASYLTADAIVEAYGDQEGMRLEFRFGEAHGSKLLLDPCEPNRTSTAGTTVRCTYAYHAIRSDEIGLGPFGDNYFDLTVLDGKVVSILGQNAFMTNGFSEQLWVPFGIWVAETYPEDAAVMYTDSTRTMQAITDESIALWEQHSQEYVQEVGGG